MAEAARKDKIHVGIAGWSYEDWKGIVYPRSKIDELAYVSGFVDVIEINSTFYRPPSERNSASWARRTPPADRFFFTAKLHQDFTHKGRIDAEMVKQFHDGFEPLLTEGKLRQLLAQFRYDFGVSEGNRRHLADIVAGFSERFEMVVELRNKTWQEAEALKFLEQLGVTVCNLDYPGSGPGSGVNCAIGQHAYLRIHGRNVEKWFSKCSRDETYNYYYQSDELKQIVGRVEDLADESLSLTVIANNHYRGAELANAMELKAMITGQKVEVPEGLLEAYPDLERIALNR